MNAFKFTDLDEGETLIFGPVTFTKTTSFSGARGHAQSSVAKTSGHSVGITNRRIIVEDIPDAWEDAGCPQCRCAACLCQAQAKRRTIDHHRHQSSDFVWPSRQTGHKGLACSSGEHAPEGVSQCGDCPGQEVLHCDSGIRQQCCP